MLKAVILIGGPQKGTRFRPLSLDIPKPLFPVAGFPMIHHLIEAFSMVPNMNEIILIGYYPLNEVNQFIQNIQNDSSIMIRYLQEYTALGTAGGMYHFRDRILVGDPELFFVVNSDVCGDLPLSEMLIFQKNLSSDDMYTILTTEATRQQAMNYGCLVEDENTHEILHYVEKPSTFVSSLINCGIYLFSPKIFEHIGVAFRKRHSIGYSSADYHRVGFEISNANNNSEVIQLERDVFQPLAGTGKLFAFQTEKFWSQIKTSSAAIYANRHYLSLYNDKHPERLSSNKPGSPKIIGDVFIHPSANVHETAQLGPNVTIGMNVTIGVGVRVRESMVLENAVIQDHSCILFSIIGRDSTVGEWARVEGTANDPNPNKPFTKIDVQGLFSPDGRLIPSITVIGSNVHIPKEVVVLNSIVLPHKDLKGSTKNQIIL